MNLFNMIEKINFNDFFYILILLIILYVARMIIGIIGVSFALTIMDTPSTHPLEAIKVREFLVIFMSILWILFKIILFKFYITALIFIPIIIYLLININNRKAKGVAFLILSVALLIL